MFGAAAQAARPVCWSAGRVPRRATIPRLASASPKFARYALAPACSTASPTACPTWPTATGGGRLPVDGPAVSLTQLGTWAVIQQLGAKVEVLPASAALTPLQLIICRLGMSGEAFEQELHAWLAARVRRLFSSSRCGAPATSSPSRR